MADTPLIGSPLDRVDGRAKVTGQARYAAEFQPQNLAHAVAVSSTIAHGRIAGIDAREATRQPGVIAILTHQNMPRLKPLPQEDKQGTPGQTLIPLQTDKIQYAGQYVALVVAETFTQAQHAAALLNIRYDSSPPDSWNESLPSEKPPKMGRSDKPDSLRGDPDAARAHAAASIKQDYRIPQENHNPMEFSATIAAWHPAATGDRLTIYTATQWINGAQHVIALALGIDPAAVHVVCPFVGGGFGCKGSVWPHELLAPAAAKALGRPVKLVLTRAQMFIGCGARPNILQHLELAADHDGKLLSIVHDTLNSTSKSDTWTESAGKQTRLLYSCPNVRTSHRVARIHSATPCQMRAPGHAPGTWALEVAMDELAYALKMDPLQLRLVNYSQRDEDENKPYSSKALRACYEQAAQRFGWSRRSNPPGSMKDGRTLVGWGMATATYPTNRQKASVHARLLTDGAAILSSATHDLGTGTYTIMTQIAAETLGLPPNRVRFELGDSQFAESPVSGGSQTAVSVGCAVKEVCEQVRKQLLQAAVSDPKSPLHRRDPASLKVDNGRINANDAHESVAAVMARHGAPIDLTAEAAPGNKEFSTHSHGADFVEVRIDPDLGRIRVSRIVGAFAAGRILNAKTGRSQILGGLVMGIGMALFEQAHYDPRRGKIVNDNLADYLLPVNADVPEIDCFFVDEPDPHVNSLGAKGIGELGITGIAAAITNAVFHATGRRIRDLPITLDKLL